MLVKKIQTVCGEINPNELGFTLTHEHLLMVNPWINKPKKLSKISKYSQKITLENRDDVLHHIFDYEDNMILIDVNDSIENIKEFILDYDGKSVVDLSFEMSGRDPGALRHISKHSGANIIMTTGRYIDSTLSDDEKKRTVKDIEKQILDEFENGVGEKKIKPGCIKMSVSKNPNECESETRGLRGGARARNKIGCCMYVHTAIFEKYNNLILDILKEEKVDLNKVVLCHCDATGDDWEYHDSLAKRGATIEYDEFGTEGHTNYASLTEGGQRNVYLPYDGDRIKYVKKQIDLGNINKIVLSGDMCCKINYKKWGGAGYSHIPKNIIPKMKHFGITDEQIHIMTVENPKNLLQF